MASLAGGVDAKLDLLFVELLRGDGIENHLADKARQRTIVADLQLVRRRRRHVRRLALLAKEQKGREHPADDEDTRANPAAVLAWLALRRRRRQR